MRPNKTETALHGCLIPARVLCKYVRKEVEDLISFIFLDAKEKKQG